MRGTTGMVAGGGGGGKLLAPRVPQQPCGGKVDDRATSDDQLGAATNGAFADGGVGGDMVGGIDSTWSTPWVHLGLGGAMYCGDVCGGHRPTGVLVDDGIDGGAATAIPTCFDYFQGAEFVVWMPARVRVRSVFLLCRGGEFLGAAREARIHCTRSSTC